MKSFKVTYICCVQTLDRHCTCLPNKCKKKGGLHTSGSAARSSCVKNIVKLYTKEAWEIWMQESYATCWLTLSSVLMENTIENAVHWNQAGRQWNRGVVITAPRAQPHWHRATPHHSPPTEKLLCLAVILRRSLSLATSFVFFVAAANLYSCAFDWNSWRFSAYVSARLKQIWMLYCLLQIWGLEFIKWLTFLIS